MQILCSHISLIFRNVYDLCVYVQVCAPYVRKTLDLLLYLYGKELINYEQKYPKLRGLRYAEL